MDGGDLHWIWKPYEIYENVDWARRIFSDQKRLLTLTIRFGCAGGQTYGLKALQDNDGFTSAQGKFLSLHGSHSTG